MAQIGPTRRRVLRAACCAACAAIASALLVRRTHAAEVPSEVVGPSYVLHFIGAQRETIMMGRREGRLDLRTLSGVPHLFGLGPIEGLTGEITIADSRPSLARVRADGSVHIEESYEAHAPFFVWAEVTGGWQTVPVPEEVQSYSDLERFVGEVGEQVGLTRAFPFTAKGRPARVGYHVLNAPPGSTHPPGAAAHEQIQVHFSLERQDVILTGFYSREHRGVFTPMISNMHVHVQDVGNTNSGHVESFDLGGSGLMLSLPRP